MTGSGRTLIGALCATVVTGAVAAFSSDAAGAVSAPEMVGKPVVTVRQSADFVVVYFRLKHFAPRRLSGTPLNGPLIDSFIGPRDPGLPGPSPYPPERPDVNTFSRRTPCYFVAEPRRSRAVKVGDVVKFSVSVEGRNGTTSAYGRAIKPRGRIAAAEARYRRQLGCR